MLRAFHPCYQPVPRQKYAARLILATNPSLVKSTRPDSSDPHCCSGWTLPTCALLLRDPQVQNNHLIRDSTMETPGGPRGLRRHHDGLGTGLWDGSEKEQKRRNGLPHGCLQRTCIGALRLLLEYMGARHLVTSSNSYGYTAMHSVATGYHSVFIREDLGRLAGL
eukprot:Rmarinus@m.27478